MPHHQEQSVQMHTYNVIGYKQCVQNRTSGLGVEAESFEAGIQLKASEPKESGGA
jgi:hypothetical protein